MKDFKVWLNHAQVQNQKFLFWIPGNKQDTPNTYILQINSLSSDHFRAEGQSLSWYFPALFLSENKEVAYTQINLFQWVPVNLNC